MDKSWNWKDTKVYYTDEGRGNVLLFVHGFCENGSMWDAFKEPFLENHRVIVPDLPGYRNATIGEEPFSMELCADYLKAIIDQEEIEKVTLIGHSMGGYTSCAFAEKFSESLGSLVLFHSHCFDDSEEKKAIRHKALKFIEEYGVPKFVKETFPSYFGRRFAGSHREFIVDWVHNAGNYPASIVVASMRAMLHRPDRSEVLRNLDVPVLFIIGKEDVSISFERSLQQTHFPPIADVHLLDRVGHMGMFEAKEITTQLLEKFIKLKVAITQT